MTDGQTDRPTDGRKGKTICLPTLAGGRHNHFKHLFKHNADMYTDMSFIALYCYPGNQKISRKHYTLKAFVLTEVPLTFVEAIKSLN